MSAMACRGCGERLPEGRRSPICKDCARARTSAYRAKKTQAYLRQRRAVGIRQKAALIVAKRHPEEFSAEIARLTEAES